MPDHRKLLLVCVLIFTALLFINFFVVHEFFPEDVPGAGKAISGLFLLVCFEVLFYVVFKRILKQHETLSVAYLTIFGCLIVLFSGLIFQTYRQATLEYTTNEDRIKIFLIGVLGLTAVAGITAFPVAVDVKYKKRWLTTLLNIGIGLLFLLGVPYLFSLLKGK
ncbi:MULTISPECIES: hypothetical protein [Niastella]|uniref:Uncharacterized protein n=1 Tax=Niastella soli TaxID=2821487 RepID=A0ABS3YVP0_9BACT|nr:hypothetical protein [Niastella soli]MBO9201236.1 hypothetical protein [Niastella soli]